MSLEKGSGRTIADLKSGWSWDCIAQPVQGQMTVFWVDLRLFQIAVSTERGPARRALPCMTLPLPSAPGLRRAVCELQRHPCPQEPWEVAGEWGGRKPCLELKAISIYVRVALPPLSALFYETNIGIK